MQADTALCVPANEPGVDELLAQNGIGTDPFGCEQDLQQSPVLVIASADLHVERHREATTRAHARQTREQASHWAAHPPRTRSLPVARTLVTPVNRHDSYHCSLVSHSGSYARPDAALPRNALRQVPAGPASTVAPTALARRPSVSTTDAAPAMRTSLGGEPAWCTPTQPRNMARNTSTGSPTHTRTPAPRNEPAARAAPLPCA